METIQSQIDGGDSVIAQDGDIHQGTIYRKDLGFYQVRYADRMVTCSLSNQLRAELADQLSGSKGDGRSKRMAKGQRHYEPLVVGDHVLWMDIDTHNGQIIELLPRSNWLSRRAAKPMATSHAFEQVMAANVDQVVAVLSATRPEPKWKLLDRYLAAAEASQLPAVVCITKLDLVANDQQTDIKLFQTLAEYERIGYPLLTTSALTGHGLDELQKMLRNKVSLLVGKSGVGKSTLLNAMQPGLGQRVRPVSQGTGKGRHTTSHLEMFPLDFGGALIDTPGMREFGLWDIEPDELDWCFPEMRPYLGACKFGLGCYHDDEPGCAVRRAVMDGQISPQRYQSYLRLCIDP